MTAGLFKYLLCASREAIVAFAFALSDKSYKILKDIKIYL